MFGDARWNSIRRSLPLLLASLLAAGACGDSPTASEGPDETRLWVYLTDAPGDVENVWVQIDDVVLVGDEGQTPLLDEPTELVDILALRDDVIALVEGAEIDPGTYGQLRFIVGGAVLETTDGQVFALGGAEHPDGVEATGTLLCPSCTQTGIKVVLRGLTVEEGEENGLLLDFDVTQSFGRQAGRSGRWVMRPVIHASTTDPGPDAGEPFGFVTGDVVLDDEVSIPECGGSERTLEEFVPVAIATTLTDDEDEAIQRSGETDAEGAFTIDILEADTYQLGHQAETEFDGEKLVWQASVTPAEAVVEDEGWEVSGFVYTVDGVSCEAA